MDSTTSAFFYGTLMHPKILKRVIGNEGCHLQICPAVLLNYTRHHVKFEDYPAVVPYDKSEKELIGKELAPEDRYVRGTLVTGLNLSDIRFLDTFEGNEYIRRTVSVYPLAPLRPLASVSSDPASASSQTIAPSTAPPLPPVDSLPLPIEAEAYIWDHPLSELNKEIWLYEKFMQENAWKWVGRQKEGECEIRQEDSREGYYAEVDRRRQMNGNIVRVAGDEV